MIKLTNLQRGKYFRVVANVVVDGVRTTWYENGKPMETMPYSKGLAHGTGRTYYETGGVFEEAKFKYGTPKVITIYNEDGSIAEQKGWIDNKIIKRIVG